MAALPTDATSSSEQVRAAPSARGIPLSQRFTDEIFAPPEPLIAELAAVAAPKATPPVAGGYAIDRFILPNDIDIPPECMIGEQDVFEFNLPEHGPPIDTKDPVCVTKNIPQELLESKGNSPYVFTPLKEKDKASAEFNANANAKASDKTNFNQMMDSDINQRLTDLKLGAAAEVAEVQKLQQEQQKVGEKAPKTSSTRTSLSKSPRPSATAAGGGGRGSRPNSRGPAVVAAAFQDIRAARSRSNSRGRIATQSQGATAATQSDATATPGAGATTPPPPNPKPQNKSNK